jgi:hypothetical protein
MTSQNLKYYAQQDFRGGIVDNQENLDPKRQVLDARNCWAPLGTCVRRPGYQAIAQYEGTLDWVAASGDTQYFDATHVDSTYPIFYMGADTPFFAVQNFNPNDTNTDAGAQYRLEYWNGTVWMGIACAQVDLDASNYASPTSLYCGTTSGGNLSFSPPGDWATTTVNAQEKYWVRYVWAGFNAPSATPTAFTGSIAPLRFLTSADYGSAYFPWGASTVGAFQFKYNQGSNFLVGYRFALKSPPATTFSAFSRLAGGVLDQTGGQTYDYKVASYQPRPVMQGTCLPEFNLAYVTYDNVVYQVTKDNVITVATVSTDPLVIGPLGANQGTYPSDAIALSPTFPAANYILNFKGHIWAAGILNEPTTVRWSGFNYNGGYNVWPETSFEFLSTAKDNSPITAIAGLGDNLVVFKQDSIWQLIFGGSDENGLDLFIPQLVVAGVGCVSQSSIQEIRGRLVFLAEDGFYAFDGTPNIKKISENVNTTVQRINPAHRPFASAVNWRSKYCYLCSVALDESTSNNIIFVYDYKHDAWWLWDDIPAEFLLVTSDTALQEQVIFGNTTAGFFQLSGELDNFGTIDNYVLTGRMGEDDVMWKSAREVRLREQNIDGATTYTLYADDLQLGVASKSCRMDSPDETQADDSPPDGCDNVPIRRRERKMPQRLLGEWFQVKAEGFGLLEGINLGYLPESRR